jgi:hypothetical protein
MALSTEPLLPAERAKLRNHRNMLVLVCIIVSLPIIAIGYWLEYYTFFGPVNGWLFSGLALMVLWIFVVFRVLNLQADLRTGEKLVLQGVIARKYRADLREPAIAVADGKYRMAEVDGKPCVLTQKQFDSCAAGRFLRLSISQHTRVLFEFQITTADPAPNNSTAATAEANKT